jgi:molybdate transport system substrate-binding protein
MTIVERMGAMKRALSILVLVAAAITATAQEITVAAAADLNLALEEIARKYEARTGARVKLTFGSSGNFFAAIRNGAPYDVFFSADIDYPKQLEAAGLTEPNTVYEYAVGRLVLWAPKNSPLDLSRGMKLLSDPRVRKIAIANPKHAPYGRAAVAAMRAAGVYESAAPKLVLGENISQTAQFLETGNAEVGLIALSLVSHPSKTGQGGTPASEPFKGGQGGAPEIDGKYWIVPMEMYPAIRQAAVVIRRSQRKEPAKKFLDYVKSDESRATLKAYGFERP